MDTIKNPAPRDLTRVERMQLRVRALIDKYGFLPSGRQMRDILALEHRGPEVWE